MLLLAFAFSFLNASHRENERVRETEKGKLKEKAGIWWWQCWRRPSYLYHGLHVMPTDPHQHLQLTTYLFSRKTLLSCASGNPLNGIDIKKSREILGSFTTTKGEPDQNGGGVLPCYFTSITTLSIDNEPNNDDEDDMIWWWGWDAPIHHSGLHSDSSLLMPHQHDDMLRFKCGFEWVPLTGKYFLLCALTFPRSNK